MGSCNFHSLRYRTHNLPVIGQTPQGHLNGLLPVAQQKGPCEPNLACYRVEWITQLLHMPLRAHGKTFGERAKPQEEVARWCSPIRENAGASCQVSAPIDPTGSAGCTACAETHRGKAIRHAGKSCEWLVAPRCLLGLLRLPITCSPLSTTPWCLLLADTVHYCKHMPRRGGAYVFIYVGRMWDANSTGTIFCFCLASSNTYSLYWRSLWGLYLMGFWHSLNPVSLVKGEKNDRHKMSDNLGVSTKHYCEMTEASQDIIVIPW